MKPFIPKLVIDVSLVHVSIKHINLIEPNKEISTSSWLILLPFKLLIFRSNKFGLISLLTRGLLKGHKMFARLGWLRMFLNLS